ncbi:hypothetical protein QR66_02340 [Chromobacterium piscinae]|nr:hypothetical protein QR66_02340 [Chromobacterium piscinae]
MDIVQNRRARLRSWIGINCGDSQARFIAQTGINQGELSALLRTKSFGEKKARALEELAGMPKGWLDRQDDESVITVREVGMDVPPLTLDGPDTERATVSSPEELAAFLGDLDTEQLLQVVKLALERHGQKKQGK